MPPLSDCYIDGTGRCGGHLYSILISNRFPNVKKVPSSVKPTLEESLFSIHNSRGVSENLLAFGRISLNYAQCSASRNLNGCLSKALSVR